MGTPKQADSNVGNNALALATRIVETIYKFYTADGAVDDSRIAVAALMVATGRICRHICAPSETSASMYSELTNFRGRQLFVLGWEQAEEVVKAARNPGQA